MSDVAACPANITERGAWRRRIFGWICASVTVVLAFVLVAWAAPAPCHLSLLVPATGAAIGFLQANRETCVLHAAAGAVELERGSRPATAEESAASRRVALGIVRDALLIGFGITSLSAIASSLGPAHR